MAVPHQDGSYRRDCGIRVPRGVARRDGLEDEGRAMKCGCGSVMTTRKEPYKYDISGPTGITLLNVPVHYCDACGERGVSIPKIEELHRLIAKAIIEKRERLVPSEVKFLRKYLGFSTADMGRYMGV